MPSINEYRSAAGVRFRLRYTDDQGKRVERRGFRTKGDARLAFSNIDVAISRGDYVDPKSARVSVATLGAKWLAGRTHMKPSAREPLDIAWRLYVEPMWGQRKIGEIRHSEVQAWVSALTTGKAVTGHKGSTTGPKSATVVIRAYGILAAILDVAVLDRQLSSNPARGVNLPRKGKKARVYLTHAQVEALAIEAGAHGTLVRLLAYSGIRWGEAVGLRVSALDLLRRRLLVRENAVRVSGGIVVGTPKSHEQRTVPVPRFLIEELSGLCVGKGRDSLVFGDGVSFLRTPTNRDGWFQQAVKRAMAADPHMPRVTIHDLRHTAASLAVSSGANVKLIQRMLGHASAAMTLDVYADLFQDDIDDVAERLDDARFRSIQGK